MASARQTLSPQMKDPRRDAPGSTVGSYVSRPEFLEHTDHDSADEQQRGEQHGDVQSSGHFHGGPPVIGSFAIDLSGQSFSAEVKRGQICAALQHNGALQNHRDGHTEV
jgi:hypothetical protein